MMNNILSGNDLAYNEIMILFKMVDNDQFENMKGKIIINAFFEPSTRTSLSFESAMKRLGGEVITYYDTHGSTKKGETFEDTIRTLSVYGDLLVLRHPCREYLTRAVSSSSIPIINGGNGDGEHPTQALIDLYVIYRQFGRDFSNKNVLFIGDMKHSRTVHSLLVLLHLFPSMKIYMFPYDDLQPSKEIIDHIKKHHHQDNVIIDITNIDVQMFDVVYCTRRQKERMHSVHTTHTINKEREPKNNDFIVDKKFAEKLHENAIILHPLPRNQELSTDVDDNKRSRYFDQMRFGVKIRQALIQKILM